MSWEEREAKRAIIHVDGDAFFASCEQALNPKLRGKPVITGKERGIVSAASYEAKACGVRRGVRLQDVKKLCPDAIILPSDYESYSLFSERMFAIMRRYTPDVEEYGIDEGFADLTGLRRALHMSYPQIAHTIKTTIEAELNLSVSVGLSVSKVLAKTGSKWDKPSGFTVIAKDNIKHFLDQTPVGTIWGIGPQTTAHIKKFGIHTAGQFAAQPEAWVETHFAKPHQEIWHELNGRAVMELEIHKDRNRKSVSKTKTFTPPSSTPEYVLAQLYKNVENACIKLRRHQLGALEFSVFLKTQEFRYTRVTAKLNRSTAFPQDMVPIIRQLFFDIFKPGTLYRATGVTFWNLQPLGSIQMNLFEGPLKIEKATRLYGSIDGLAKKYGKHTVFHGGSLLAHSRPDQRQHARQEAQHDNHVLRVRRSRKFLTIPLLGQVR